MELHRGDSTGMFVCSLASVISSLSVIVTYWLFPYLQNKSSRQVILYLAVSNFLSACGSIPGEPISGSFACWFEGIVTNIFTLVSILWTDVTCYMIYCIVACGQGFELNRFHHLLCWGLPVVVTVLPLINATYGAPNDMGWCWVVATSKTPKWGLLFWYWISFYAVVWAGLAVMIWYFFLAHFCMRRISTDARWAAMVVLMKLRWYAIVIGLSWVLPTVADTLNLATNFDNDFAKAPVLSSIANILPCLQGVMTAFVFWFTNDDVRTYWYIFLTTGRLEGVNNGRVAFKSQDATIQDCKLWTRSKSYFFSGTMLSSSNLTRVSVSTGIVPVGKRWTQYRASSNSSYSQNSFRGADARISPGIFGEPASHSFDNDVSNYGIVNTSVCTSPRPGSITKSCSPNSFRLFPTPNIGAVPLHNNCHHQHNTIESPRPERAKKKDSRNSKQATLLL